MDQGVVEGGRSSCLRLDRSCRIELSWKWNNGFWLVVEMVGVVMGVVTRWRRERRKEGRKGSIRGDATNGRLSREWKGGCERGRVGLWGQEGLV